jgi:hypothetical protein
MKDAVLAVLCAMAAPALAQDQLSPNGFLDLAVGRTLSFSNVQTGRLVGEEQFLRRDLSVWTNETGRCTYGRIEVRGPSICFLYEDSPNPENCWIPFSDEGTLLVLSQNSREVQKISDISEEPIMCEGAPSS